MWMLAALTTGLAFYTTYHGAFSGSVVAMIWLCWLLISAGLLSMTAQGKSVLAFAKEANIEMQKVVWPTRQETMQTTMIVMIMVGIAGFVLWGLDSLMMSMIAKLTHLG